MVDGQNTSLFVICERTLAVHSAQFQFPCGNLRIPCFFVSYVDENFNILF